MSINGKSKRLTGNFSQVGNTVLRDKKLSLRAKGLYSLIQSYITIDGFKLNKQMLNNQSKEGREAFNKAWKELIDSGYLVITRNRIKGGKFAYDYELTGTPDTKTWYQGYLQSKHWKEFRLIALKHHGDKCCKCGGDYKISVHHLNYDNVGNESVDDVIVVCDNCHKEIHGIKAGKA